MEKLQCLLEKRLDHSFEQKARELATHAALNYFNLGDYKLAPSGYKDRGDGFDFEFKLPDMKIKVSVTGTEL